MTNIIKNIIKILIIILMIQVIFAIANKSHAGFWSDVFSHANDFLNEGRETANEGKITIGEAGASSQMGLPTNKQLRYTISDVYNVLFLIAVPITMIVGGILGIKYMMASADDKAKLKESLVPYVIGCAVIYASFGIWRLAIIIFSGIF